MYKLLVTTIVEGRSVDSGVSISVVTLEFEYKVAADQAYDRLSKGSPRRPSFVGCERTVEKLYE